MRNDLAARIKDPLLPETADVFEVSHRNCNIRHMKSMLELRIVLAKLDNRHSSERFGLIDRGGVP